MDPFDTEADRYDRWFDSVEGQKIFAQELACVCDPTGRFVGSLTNCTVSGLRSDLNTGIQFGIHLDIEFEFKITVLLFRAKKRVPAACLGRPHNGPVHNAIRSRTVLLHPAIECLTIEQLRSTARCMFCTRCGTWQA